MILVDTSVWSRAYRRRSGAPEEPSAARLRALIVAGSPVAIPGIVLQELLSGLRSGVESQRLESALAPFPLVLATRTDHVRAATLWNTCRASGVTVSAIDALVSALAIERGASLFADDADFEAVSRFSPLRLFKGA